LPAIYITTSPQSGTSDIALVPSADVKSSVVKVRSRLLYLLVFVRRLSYFVVFQKYLISKHQSFRILSG